MYNFYYKYNYIRRVLLPVNSLHLILLNYCKMIVNLRSIKKEEKNNRLMRLVIKNTLSFFGYVSTFDYLIFFLG